MPSPVAIDHILTLPDGRLLGYREFGDPAGAPVIALHGTPGSRFKYASSHGAAAAYGLRLIALDRWGYGLSSAKPDARLADFGTDVAALADALRLDRVAVTGVSGGAPFAVATAAALKDRVSALALVSPVGILVGQGGRAALSPFHTVCFRILPHLPGAVPAVFHAYRAGLALAPDAAMAVVMSRSPAADRVAIQDDATRARLIETFRTGLAPGVAGPTTDMALFAKPWALALADITASARVWMGLDDRNVPLTAVRALVSALPRCDCVDLPDAGHLWVARNAHRVMEWLAVRAGLAPDFTLDDPNPDQVEAGRIQRPENHDLSLLGRAAGLSKPERKLGLAHERE